MLSGGGGGDDDDDDDDDNNTKVCSPRICGAEVSG